MKNEIIEVRFNDLPPTEYNYKYFDVIFENGDTKTFHYNINNPMPKEDEILGLTWNELVKLCKKMFYEAIGVKESEDIIHEKVR